MILDEKENNHSEKHFRKENKRKLAYLLRIWNIPSPQKRQVV